MWRDMIHSPSVKAAVSGRDGGDLLVTEVTRARETRFCGLKLFNFALSIITKNEYYDERQTSALPYTPLTGHLMY